jgi:FAD/FMN-containing dehydrogenase
MPSLEQAALSKGGGTFIGAYAFWDDSVKDDASRAWVRTVMSTARSFGAGSYVGEADLSGGADRAQQCFSPEAWTRLVAVRQKHDPDGRFFSYLTDA